MASSDFPDCRRSFDMLVKGERELSDCITDTKTHGSPCIKVNYDKSLLQSTRPGIFMLQKFTSACSFIYLRTINSFKCCTFKEFAYRAIMGLCISFSSKGLQQEPREKLYSQLAMPGNICHFHIQFTWFPPNPQCVKTGTATDIFVTKRSNLSYISPWKKKYCLL